MDQFTSTDPRKVYVRLNAAEAATWEAESALADGIPRPFQEAIKRLARAWAETTEKKRRRRIYTAVIESPTAPLLAVYIGRPIKLRRA